LAGNYSRSLTYAPNDKPEQEKMDTQSEAWRLVMQGKLFYSPVPRPKKVLDLGTGTGRWAEDMGDKHPLVGFLYSSLSNCRTRRFVQLLQVVFQAVFSVKDFAAMILH
jgi:hypothetical protein